MAFRKLYGILKVAFYYTTKVLICNRGVANMFRLLPSPSVYTYTQRYVHSYMYYSVKNIFFSYFSSFLVENFQYSVEA